MSFLWHYVYQGYCEPREGHLSCLILDLSPTGLLVLGAHRLGDMALHSTDIDLLALESLFYAQLCTGIMQALLRAAKSQPHHWGF